MGLWAQSLEKSQTQELRAANVPTGNLRHSTIDSKAQIAG
jgi:hypothetical protein